MLFVHNAGCRLLHPDNQRTDKRNMFTFTKFLILIWETFRDQELYVLDLLAPQAIQKGLIDTKHGNSRLEMRQNLPFSASTCACAHSNHNLDMSCCSWKTIIESKLGLKRVPA